MNPYKLKFREEIKLLLPILVSAVNAIQAPPLGQKSKSNPSHMCYHIYPETSHPIRSPKGRWRTSPIQLADPNFYQSSQIDVLIGADILPSIIFPFKFARNTPWPRDHIWVDSLRPNREESHLQNIFLLSKVVCHRISTRRHPYQVLKGGGCSREAG